MSSSLCVRRVELDAAEIQLFFSWRSIWFVHILWVFTEICPTSIECVRLLSTLIPLLLEQCKWNFIFSLKKKLLISPFPLIKILIIQASLLKGKHLFTGSVSTGGICWYYFIMISIAKFTGSIICSPVLKFVRSCAFKNH